MAEAWEQEVLDAFSDILQDTLERQVATAPDASAPADVGVRGLESVDFVGRHLDRIFRKVSADLKAYRESTEASFKYASQAQKHMQKLYMIAADDAVDDIPPQLGASQHGLVQAVKSLFETRFDDHVRGSVQQLHRRLQILLETYEAMQIRRGQQTSQRIRLVGLLSGDNTAENPEESDKALADMCSLELEEVRKQIVTSLPTTTDMLQTIQTNIYESALRSFTDDHEGDTIADDAESSLTSNASTLRVQNKTLPESFYQAATEQHTSGGHNRSPPPRESEQRSGGGRKFRIPFFDSGLAFGLVMGVLLAVVREKVLQRSANIGKDDGEDNDELVEGNVKR